MDENTWLEDMCAYYNIIRFSTALADGAVSVRVGERALWVSADGKVTREVRAGERVRLNGGRLLVISPSVRRLTTYVNDVTDL